MTAGRSPTKSRRSGLGDGFALSSIVANFIEVRQRHRVQGVTAPPMRALFNRDAKLACLASPCELSETVQSP